MDRLSIGGWASWFVVTDEQAMWRVQTRDDAQAFAHLVERWDRRIWDLCARMTGDPDRAEDLKQEVLTRLFLKRKEYRPNQRLSTWLWRIALNRCYDELRRTQRRPEVPLAPVDTEEGDPGPEGAVDGGLPPDLQAAREEEGAMVREALQRLPEMYRTVLVLRHYSGLKLREIAEILEVPEGTVNSRMAEALARLTRLLEPAFQVPGYPSMDSAKSLTTNNLALLP
jgi:RNA polymerase sigma-70 factor (ECF subfamily)